MSAAIIPIIGAVVSGVGSAMAAKKQREAEEKARIAEEKRREERYAGIGEAVASTQPVRGSALGGNVPERQTRDPVGKRTDRVGLEAATKLDKSLGKAGPEAGSLEARLNKVTGRRGPLQPNSARTQPALPKNQARVARSMEQSQQRYQYDPGQGRIIRA
ncbi:hypothetical protein [Roseovarius sp.]|uniref:hypothetical protein n=1 Tax=Roseovarius sp. TaxID=1486281 RepID=UPI003BA91A73